MKWLTLKKAWWKVKWTVVMTARRWWRIAVEGLTVFWTGCGVKGYGPIGWMRLVLPRAVKDAVLAVRGKEVVVRTAKEFRREMKGAYTKGELVKIIMAQNKVIAEYAKKHGDKIIRKVGGI